MNTIFLKRSFKLKHFLLFICDYQDQKTKALKKITIIKSNKKDQPSHQKERGTVTHM